jgi:hypothetical protein
VLQSDESSWPGNQSEVWHQRIILVLLMQHRKHLLRYLPTP